MRGAIAPVDAISYPDEQSFAIEAVDVFYDEGYLRDDECTSTVLVRVIHEQDRGEMRDILRERLTSTDAQRLIRFLDANDWEVSFFVDGRD